jgi:hypothetical protein
VDRGGDVGILRVDVRDDLAVGAVEADVLARIADLAANVPGDLLEVDLVGGDTSLTEKDDLKIGETV